MPKNYAKVKAKSFCLKQNIYNVFWNFKVSVVKNSGDCSYVEMISAGHPRLVNKRCPIFSQRQLDNWSNFINRLRRLQVLSLLNVLGLVPLSLLTVAVICLL